MPYCFGSISNPPSLGRPFLAVFCLRRGTMDSVRGGLTVFFDDPFWVGVFSVTCGGKLCASRVVFGAEPRDGEVYDFILKNYKNLKFSPPVRDEKAPKKVNPKKQNKLVHKQLKNCIGTKSQQALSLQREHSKAERASFCREKRAELAERKFCLKQQKKREKHKGR